LLMSAPVFRDLRAKYPDAQIHLLTNAQSLRALTLLPGIDKVHSFDRDDFQQALASVDRPFFEGFDRLSQLIDSVNSENYDLVINMTHTRLSGYLMSLIEAKEKNGLCIDAQMRPSFGSKWFRFLNEQVELDGKDSFHFNDIFRYALGLAENGSRGVSLRLTDAARAEASNILSVAQCEGAFITVQPLTSDKKKDWSLKAFAAALQILSDRHPELSFAILAAPFEVDSLQAFVNELKTAGLKAFLAVSSLEGAAGLIERSRLLLTGDTSIKHVAAGLGVKIVEIALGSSDSYRTGAYRQGSVVLRSREVCAPCTHSKACHRERQFCSENMPADAVAMITSEVYSGHSFQMRTVAKEFASEIEIMKVDCQSMGRFELVNVVPEFSEHSVARSVDRLCKTLWLSDLRRPVDGVGTETRHQWNLLKTEFSNVSDFEWRHLFSTFETQVIAVEGRIHSLKVGLKVLNAGFEELRGYPDYVRSLIHFREKIRNSPLMGLMLPLLDSVVEDDISPPFVKLRRLNDVVNEIQARASLYRSVIRALDKSVESLLEMENP
jgi:ADP-heptose:LPS heptosyltransferase